MWRLPLLKAKTKLESAISREAAFLYNNLLLVALCLTILWGVAWPILSEAVRGESVVVGRPYYDFFLRIFGLPLLLLMGIGPLVAWRRASLRGLAATFAWSAGAALLAGVLLLALGAGSSIPGLVAYTFSAFVLGTIVLEFVRGTRARRALSGGTWPQAFGALVARNRRRYGGYVVHAAIVLLAVGIAGSSAYDTVSEGRLRPGETIRAGDYALTFRSLSTTQAQNATETRALLGVRRGGDDLGTIRAGKNSYPVEQQISNEVGIRSDPVRAEDLFVIAEQVNRNGTVDFRVFVKPLVNLIWLAGLLFVLGSLVTLWPDAREQRRLALRYGELGAPASTR
jgi:cytochrome c-type biogenesis protein CcmF